jgi:DNA-binding MarR family transcriptional regulator
MNERASPKNTKTRLKGVELPAGHALGFMRKLWAIDHGLRRLSRQMSRQLGVTGPQRLAIRVIGRSPSATAGEVASELHLHPSTLTGVLARLEGAGLIRRHIDPHDGRRTRLTLTAKGRRVDRSRSGTVEECVESALLRSSARDRAAAERVLNELALSLGQR